MSGYHAKKRLGQNFLISESVIDRIVGLANAVGCDNIIEIGPGQGALTKLLAASGKKITAVEFDRDLIPTLKRIETDFPNLSIANTDFLKFDPDDAGYDSFALVGNLPYNITSPVIDWAIGHRTRISGAVFMVQKEIAERLAAVPGSKAWSPLSIFTQLHFKVSLCFDVPPDCFRPVPEVISTVIELIRIDCMEIGDYSCFEKVVRRSFKQRRKKLINNLVPDIFVDRVQAEAIFLKLGLKENCRAEELSIDDFRRLSESLSD